MSKMQKTKLYLRLSAVIVFVLAFFCTSIVSAQIEPPLGIEQKLAGISEEEKIILQNLFTLSQEIEVMENEEKELVKEIDGISKEIKDLGIAMASEQSIYIKKRDGLKLVLKSYQRMGPSSYMEIIMDSDSIATFLRRVNTLRDITRNTGKLLQQLETSKEKLSAEEKKLAEKLVLLRSKKEQSEEALSKKLKLKDEQEAYLLSLKEEGKYYQEQLVNLHRSIDELKPLLAQGGKELASIVEEGGLTPDVLKITFSFVNIKGSIGDQALNDIISKRPGTAGMVFGFHPGEIEISLPEKNLVLKGEFLIQDGHALKFQVKEGSFYGMALEREYIEELLSGADLTLDFKPLLGSYTLQSINIKEGYLELSAKLDLF